MNIQETIETTVPAVLIKADQRSKVRKPRSREVSVVAAKVNEMMVTELEKPVKFDAKKQGLIDAIAIAEADMKTQITRRDIAKERCAQIDHDSTFLEWVNALRDGLKAKGYTQGSCDVIRSEYLVMRTAYKLDEKSMQAAFEQLNSFAAIVQVARKIKETDKAKKEQARAGSQAANDSVIAPPKPPKPEEPKYMKEKGFEARLEKIAVAVDDMRGKVDVSHLRRAGNVILDQLDSILTQFISIAGKKFDGDYEDLAAESQELRTHLNKVLDKASKAQIEEIEKKSTKQI